jgi:hypothetical protein
VSARTLAHGLIESIDRCDPTRSHESKPSARMSARRQEWRLIRAIAFAILSASALSAAAIALLSH